MESSINSTKAGSDLGPTLYSICSANMSTHTAITSVDEIDTLIATTLWSSQKQLHTCGQKWIAEVSGRIQGMGQEMECVH